MKKICLAFCLLAVSAFLSAQTTEDHLTLTGRANKTLDPGSNDETYYVTVSLNGVEKRYYTGVQMDIVFPDNVTPVFQNGEPRTAIRTIENGLFPYTRPITDYDDDDEPIYGNPVYTHSIAYNYLMREDGKQVLRVGCYSSKNENFSKFSGDILRIWVKAGSYAKPQETAFYLDNVKLITQDEIGYVPTQEMKGVSVTAKSSLNLTVSGTNHWSTCVLPFTAAVPEGVKAYTVSSYDAENLNLKEEKTMEAYTPYILYSERGYQGTLSGTVDATGYPEKGYTDGSVLKGAIVAQTVKNGYVMQKQDGVVMFYKIAEGDSFSVPAGKCWLELPAGSSAKSLSFTFEDETGIDTVRPAVKTSDIYLIDGRRVSEPQPGKLYIKGGAKYVKQ